MYLFQCISHGDSKNGHEILQFWHFLQNLLIFWPVVCTRLPRGKHFFQYPYTGRWWYESHDIYHITLQVLGVKYSGGTSIILVEGVQEEMCNLLRLFGIITSAFCNTLFRLLTLGTVFFSKPRSAILFPFKSLVEHVSVHVFSFFFLFLFSMCWSSFCCWKNTFMLPLEV